MAKTRLNMGHKSRLNVLARSLVKAPHEQKAADDAYRIAALLIRDAITAIYPTKDMKLLKQYDCVTKITDVKIVFPSGQVSAFTLREPDHLPVPQWKNTRIFQVDQNTADAVERFKALEGAHKKALTEKLNDYFALISESTTFESLVEIWPEADQCREAICGEARYLTTVTPDVIGRIKADMMLRVGHHVGGA